MDILAFGDLLHEAWQVKAQPQQSSFPTTKWTTYTSGLAPPAPSAASSPAPAAAASCCCSPRPSATPTFSTRFGRIHVPFEFESGGSQIIFYEPGVDYREAEKARDRVAVPVQGTANHVRGGLMNRHSRIFVAGSDTLVGAAMLELLAEAASRTYSASIDEPDLTDATAVDASSTGSGRKYVFLAGGKSGGIALNRERPADLMLDNLRTIANVLDAAQSFGTTKLLYLASSCAYPKEAPQPLASESLLAGPLEPTSEAYAMAKLAGWKLCEAYRRQYGCRFITGFPANAFGPHDDFDPASGHVDPRTDSPHARGETATAIAKLPSGAAVRRAANSSIRATSPMPAFSSWRSTRAKGRSISAAAWI